MTPPHASLHTHWQQFKKGLCDERTLAETIYRHVLKNPGRFKLVEFPQDERHDLLASMYPRMLKAIHAYCPASSSFDAYIHSIIHWEKVELKRQQCSLSQGEAIAWRYRRLEELRDNETRYPGYTKEQTTVKRPMGSKKQYLILLLKLCPTLSDALIERFASCTGMLPKTLFALVEQVKTIYLGVSGRLEYERKREEYWARIILLQGQLESELASPKERDTIERKLQRAKTRLTNLKTKQGPQAVGVRNWIIAKVLGISQSSVSSSLRSFRRLVGQKAKRELQPVPQTRVHSCIPAKSKSEMIHATTTSKPAAAPLSNPF